jgi:GDP-L-fucose synthase
MTDVKQPIQRVFVAGHRGMVGAALVRLLSRLDGVEVLTRQRSELDLTDELSTTAFFREERPDVVIMAAARVGGIHANRSYPVEFLIDNVRMSVNVIQGAYEHGVQRLLFLGSTCIYPKLAEQPIVEPALLTSPLEETNEAYALAKITGLKLCQYYRRQYGVCYHSAMPTNLYGPGDNYHPEHSHVLPALIRRFHEAKLSGAESVAIWGTGTPRRELLHVDDLAAACWHLVGLADPPEWVNVGTGEDLTIMELAQRVAEVVGYLGRITTDPSRPDGTPRKLTDTRLIRETGWRPRIGLQEGLRTVYDDFLAAVEADALRAV